MGGRRCNPEDEIVFVTGNLLGDRQVVSLIGLGILQIDGEVLTFHDSGILQRRQEAFTCCIQRRVLYILRNGDFIRFTIRCPCIGRSIGGCCCVITGVSGILRVRSVVVSAARSHKHQAQAETSQHILFLHQITPFLCTVSARASM
ncbi:hypothetical protein D3C73_1301060 [compost metagenome]